MVVEESSPRGSTRRRRKNVAGGRSHVHKVRVSPEEAGRLAVLAEGAGVSVPRLLVDAALSEDRGLTVADHRQVLTELFRVDRVLSGAASNVNQLARHANATGELPEQLEHTLAQMRAAVEQLHEAALRWGVRS